MTISYDLSSSDETTLTISKVRLRIGDHNEGAGVLPNGGNLKDAELLELYTSEGSHVMRTVAAAMELLAAVWSGHAGEYRLGPESEASRQAAQYAARADGLRKRFGYVEDDAASGRQAAIAIRVRPAGQ